MTIQSPGAIPLNPSGSLTERVRGRVAEAGLALDRQEGGAAAKPGRLRPTRLSTPAARSRETGDTQRESRSLRRVYEEIKTTYQQYRRKTGRPAEPALREAVHAFKRGPSLTSLVGIAAFLDDRGILGW